MQISHNILINNGLNRTRVFLILFCVVLAAQLLLAFGQQLRYFKTEPSRIYGAPPRLLGRFALPSLSALQFALLGGVLVISLMGAALNFAPRILLLLALLCYFLYFNPIMSLAYVQRKTNLVPIALLVLMFGPAISAPLKEATPLWPLSLIKITVALMYFSAGLQKLRRCGLRWCDGRSLQAYLVEHYLWGDTKRALKLAHQLRVCSFLSSMILFFELTFWVVLILPQLTVFYVVAGIAFHIGTALTMRINYLKYLSPVYMVFLTDVAIQLSKIWG